MSCATPALFSKRLGMPHAHNLGPVGVVLVLVLAFMSPSWADTTPEHAEYVASMFLEMNEQTDRAVPIMHEGQLYYWVPFTENGSIRQDFPGLMTYGDGGIVNDPYVLRELFRYPGLVLQYSSTMYDFQELSRSKAAMLEEYLSIIRSEKESLYTTYGKGLLGSIFFDCGNLLTSAAGLVNAGITQAAAQGASAFGHLSAFAQEFAGSTVQDEAIRAATASDVDVMERILSACNHSDSAMAHVQAARDAWYALSDNSASMPDIHASLNSLAQFFAAQAMLFQDMKEAFMALGRYPDFISGYGQGNFDQGMRAFDDIIAGFNAEAAYWAGKASESELFLDMWVDSVDLRMSGYPDV